MPPATNTAEDLFTYALGQHLQHPRHLRQGSAMRSGLAACRSQYATTPFFRVQGHLISLEATKSALQNVIWRGLAGGGLITAHRGWVVIYSLLPSSLESARPPRPPQDLSYKFPRYHNSASVPPSFFSESHINFHAIASVCHPPPSAQVCPPSEHGTQVLARLTLRPIY